MHVVDICRTNLIIVSWQLLKINIFLLGQKTKEKTCGSAIPTEPNF